MVERIIYSYMGADERDKYGNYGKPLSKPGKCVLCGATVLRLYDEGICFMCKLNRTADTASKVFGRPDSSTKILNKKLRTMPQKRDEEQKLSTMPQKNDAEQRQSFEHTQHLNSVEPESFLFKDEEVLLQNQASYSKSRGGPWKVGSLCLTNKRLVFFQHSGLVFQTAVEDIMDVGVRKGRFVLGVKKPLLFLLYKSQVDTVLISEREKTFLALFAMNEPERWENEIRKAVVFVRMTKE